MWMMPPVIDFRYCGRRADSTMCTRQNTYIVVRLMNSKHARLTDIRLTSGWLKYPSSWMEASAAFLTPETASRVFVCEMFPVIGSRATTAIRQLTHTIKDDPSTSVHVTVRLTSDRRHEL